MVNHGLDNNLSRYLMVDHELTYGRPTETIKSRGGHGHDNHHVALNMMEDQYLHFHANSI